MEDWEHDLKMIKMAGLKLIRTWIPWSYVNPKEDIWIWDDYDNLFNLAQEVDLKLLIQLHLLDPTPPPKWFSNKAFNQKVRCLESSGRRSDILCFHNPDVITYGEKYVEKVVERYKNHPALYAIDLWNEPHFPICFCDFTQKEFRRFLKLKYGNLKTISHAWKQKLSNFREIVLQKEGISLAYNIDFYEFHQWVQKKLMKWLYNTVRKFDKIHPLASHFHGLAISLLHPFDTWHLSEVVDIWGTGCYNKNLAEVAIKLHGTATVSKDKPWWLSEMCSGRTWSNIGDFLRSDNFIKSCLVLAMSFGADATIFWQWRPEIFLGSESPHFGLTGLNGGLTSRTRMVKNFTSMIKRNKNLFEEMFFLDSKISLLWEPRTIAYEERYHTVQRASNLWIENFVGWYKALLESNYSFDILNSRIVANEGIQEKIRILIAPIQVFNRKKMTKQIKTWVQKGGILVAGPLYGLYDEYGIANKRVPPEWLGVDMYELYYPKQPIVRFVDEKLQYLESLPATHFIEALKIEDAEVLGVVEEKIVVTRKALGKGEIIYIGTFVGNKYDYETSPHLQRFIEKVVLKAGISTLVKASSGCYLRIAKSGKGIILFLTNPRKKAVKTWLTFSNLQGNLIDLYKKRIINRITEKNRSIHILLSAEESKIYFLKKENNSSNFFNKKGNKK
jgi:beta-galactosidase GanA